jgi:hypothetical protein
MVQKNPVNICWLGKKHKENFICFIPFTIDGVGKTVHKSLENLELEVSKIIIALRKSKIKCNFSIKSVKKAIHNSSWWKHEKTLCGKAYNGKSKRI